MEHLIKPSSASVRHRFPIRSPYSNKVILGDCIDVLKQVPRGHVDLIITDPPYLVNYKDRDGRSILNDRHSDWIKPAFREAYRVLKNDSFCVSFYGWHKVEDFMQAWKDAGFTPVGHIVWHKKYASNSRFLKYSHEQAYLLAKGNPEIPEYPLSDIQPWHYSGNELHPTQKSEKVLEPLIESFSKKNDLILDPFCGSGSTVKAAKNTGRRFLGIEKSPKYFEIAQRSLNSASEKTRVRVPW